MSMLIVMVFVGALQRPAFTAYIPYPTRYTCEEAQETLYPESFVALTKRKARKVHVTSECVPSNNIS
jgi:hypothetical protein